MLVGGGITTILGIQRLVFDVQLSGRPLLLLGILLLVTGLQFVTTGLIGELLVRTYHESRDKHAYWMRDVLE